MTDHKFEPFEKVLVRNADDEKWKADFYSHHRSENWPYQCAGDVYKQCILYTPETAHLLGTSQPYEPPKPPQEYEWGQKVKVLIGREWDKGLYIGCIPISLKHRVYTNKHGDRLFSYTEIHPLTDTAAH